MSSASVLREIRSPGSGRTLVPACVVAIPVRNEAAQIERCLAALDRQCDRDGHALPAHAFGCVLLLNGCTDDSWQRARQILLRWQRPWRMREVLLAQPRNHAGGARALALEAALHHVGPGGVVLTTDADSEVPGDWVARGMAALSHHVQALAGQFDVPEGEQQQWLPSLRRRHALETTYASLLDAIDAQCDPLGHNPLPTHRTCSGACMGFKAAALRELLPLPAPPCGEDRALIAALLERDQAVRFDVNWRVRTAGRMHGRAVDGMADTLLHRAHHKHSACDPALEPISRAVVRAQARAAARQLFCTGMRPAQLGQRAGIRVPRITHDVPVRYFGEAWHWLEQHAPALARHALTPRDLPTQIRLARLWLERAELSPGDAEVAA